jgi:biopolymer transport protein ExbB/TolQ
MNCTAFGLITAVFALLMMGLLNGKTQKIIDDINAATVQVLNLVVGNRSKVDLQNLPAE